MNPPLTPCHDKLILFREQAETISEFLEYLEDEGLEVVRCNDGDHEVIGPQELIAGFLKIDRVAFDDEKTALLDYVRHVAQLAGDASKAFDTKLVNE